MIMQARAAMPEGEFYVGPAEKLPLPDASVDLVMSTLSFHHWQDQSQGVCEVARVLRPGGQFYLADTIPPKWIMKIYHHGTMVQPAGLRAMFTQAHLKLLSQQRVLGWFFYLSVCEQNHTQG
jgi:ubiquinone/menaquinone biosynthesis C-methylase UbiE